MLSVSDLPLLAPDAAAESMSLSSLDCSTNGSENRVESSLKPQGQAAATNPAQPLSLRDELGIFLSTFITIFLAEVGDKTQVTVLLMSAQSKAPWVVFLGAGSALIATSLCGVLLGKWLSTRVSPRLLDKAAAVLLLLVAGMLLLDVIQG